MAERSFLGFGKKEQDGVARINAQIERVKEKLRDEQNVLAQVRRETKRLVSEAEKKVEQAKREQSALDALRHEAEQSVKTAEKHKADIAADTRKKIELASKSVALAEKKLDAVREKEYAVEKHLRAMHEQEARVEKLKQEEKELTAHVAELEKTIKEKNAQIHDSQKQVSHLTKELSQVLEEIKEKKHVERKLQQTKEKEQRLQDAVKKIETRVGEGARILSKQEEDIERHKRILALMKKEVKDAAPEKKRIESELRDARRELQAIVADGQKLKESMDAAKQQSALVKQQAIDLVRREKELQSQEARIAGEQQKLERLREETMRAQQEKQEALAVLSDKKRILEHLKNTINDNTNLLERLREEEMTATKAANHAIREQKKLDEREKQLALSEKSITQREATWLEHNKMLKEAQNLLEKEKAELAETVKERKAELAMFEREWEKRMGGLSKQKTDLERQKASVSGLIKGDVNALKEKEDELLKMVADMEADKSRLEKDEQSVLKKIKDLESAQVKLAKENEKRDALVKKQADQERLIKKSLKFIEKEKKKIEKAKDEIYRARELRKELPKLEKRHTAVQRSYDKLAALTMDKRIKPTLRRLREREKELGIRSEGIEKEVGKLLAMEQEVASLENRKEKAFKEYLREEVERIERGKPGRDVAHPGIHAMIDDARERLMHGNIDEAVRLVAELEVAIEKVKDNAERRTFEYDIRDLKTSIKLATLA